MPEQKTALSKKEALEQSIRDLLEGISFNQTVVKGVRIDDSPAGIVNVQLHGEYQVLGSLQLPPGWHQHEFEVVATTGANARDVGNQAD